MMRTMLTLVMIVAVALPLAAQEVEQRDFAAAAQSQEFYDRVEHFMDLGMSREEATVMSMIASGELDSSQMMLLMMLMDGGGMGGDAFGMMMFMNQMQGSQAPAQPVVIDRGEVLLIVEGGVLYKINPETMEVEGQLAYAKKGMPPDEFAKILTPMMQEARERAQQTACLSNMKQLCLAALMYAQDWDEKLPPAAWVAEIEPYHKNAQILVCPSRPHLQVAYAMNEQLQGVALAEVRKPAETILFFEVTVEAPNPAGGPELVPEGGIHNGGINVGYVDGHCRWVQEDVAREELGRPIF